MNEIKEFIEAFFKIEAKARHSWGFPDIDAFNSNLNDLNDFCTSELHDSFGMLHLLEPEDEEFYEDSKDDPYPNVRHLFKISEYDNSEYGKVYVVYSSKSSPYDDYFVYYHCFFIAKINNSYKIIKKYRFTDDSRMLDHNVWIEEEGLDKVTFKNLGKFIQTERYLEPVDCKFSMEDYKQDK